MDKLQELNGVGPVIEEKLLAAGLETFGQIAQLSAEELSAQVGVRPGRAEGIIASAADLAGVAAGTGDAVPPEIDEPSSLRSLAKAMLKDPKGIDAFAEAAGAEWKDALGEAVAKRLGKRLRKKGFRGQLIKALGRELRGG